MPQPDSRDNIIAGHYTDNPSSNHQGSDYVKESLASQRVLKNNNKNWIEAD